MYEDKDTLQLLERWAGLDVRENTQDWKVLGSIPGWGKKKIFSLFFLAGYIGTYEINLYIWCADVNTHGKKIIIAALISFEHHAVQLQLKEQDGWRLHMIWIVEDGPNCLTKILRRGPKQGANIKNKLLILLCKPGHTSRRFSLLEPHFKSLLLIL